MLTSKYTVDKKGNVSFYYDNGADYKILVKELDDPEWPGHLAGKGINIMTTIFAIKEGYKKARKEGFNEWLFQALNIAREWGFISSEGMPRAFMSAILFRV